MKLGRKGRFVMCRARSTCRGADVIKRSSNGVTFSPPDICGLDGSKPARRSRWRTRLRAKSNASLRFVAWRRAALKNPDHRGEVQCGSDLAQRNVTHEFGGGPKT